MTVVPLIDSSRILAVVGDSHLHGESFAASQTSPRFELLDMFTAPASIEPEAMPRALDKDSPTP